VETPYIEIIFVGGAGSVKKLLADLNAESPSAFGPFFISSDVGITDEGRVRKVLEAMQLIEDHEHILAPAKDLSAIRKRVADSGIKIHSAHVVVEKRLSFKFECFNEDVTGKIKAVFESLPPGVILEGYDPKTKRDDSAKGQELYSPTHHYEFSGQGVAKGPVKGLIELRKAITELPHIEVEEISLVLGDEASD
jgi:hypothetical protein